MTLRLLPPPIAPLSLAREIQQQIIGAVKESTSRIGSDGLRYDFAVALRRRTPTNAELFLAPCR